MLQDELLVGVVREPAEEAPRLLALAQRVAVDLLRPLVAHHPRRLLRP